MENFYDNIELYLDKELSPEDTAAFENALASDLALQKALAEEQATRATLYAMMVDGFRQRAIAEDAKEAIELPNLTQDKQEAKIITMGWQRWAIAAALIAAVFTTVLLFNNNKSIDYAALSSKYTFDSPVPKVQDASAEKQLTDQFYSEIKAENYQKALTTYDQLPAALQNDGQMIFFKAFCLLKMKDFQNAQTAFQTAAAANLNPTLKTDIEWYILMAKLGNKEDIKAALEIIANDDKHSYQTKAKALLKEL